MLLRCRGGETPPKVLTQHAAGQWRRAGQTGELLDLSQMHPTPMVSYTS